MFRHNLFLYPYKKINDYCDWVFDKLVGDSFRIKNLLLAMFLTYFPLVVLIWISFPAFIVLAAYMYYCDYLTKEKK
jgi:hypothetical protein